MSAHAQLSPSSAVRWMTCPGSVRMCEGIPDTSSDASLEGTMMHTVASHCLSRTALLPVVPAVTPRQARRIRPTEAPNPAAKFPSFWDPYVQYTIDFSVTN